MAPALLSSRFVPSSWLIDPRVGIETAAKHRGSQNHIGFVMHCTSVLGIHWVVDILTGTSEAEHASLLHSDMRGVLRTSVAPKRMQGHLPFTV